MKVNELGTYGLETPQTQRNTGELGKDDFLKLFVEQLRSQDPLSPMDNNEFIAQSAQFTQLEQMENLNNNMTEFLEKQSDIMDSVLHSQTSTQALNLVDKHITALVKNAAGGFDEVQGKVDKVVFNSGQQILNVGGREVFLSEVAEVRGLPEQEEV